MSQEQESSQPHQAEQPSIWNSLLGTVTGAVGTVGSAVAQAGELVTGGVTGAAETISTTAVQAGSTIVGVAASTSEAAGGAIVQASGAVTGAMAKATEAAGSTVVHVGQAVAGTAVLAGATMSSAAVKTAQGVGYAIDVIANNPMFQQLTKVLPSDWMIILDRVDVDKAEVEVKKLQGKYPAEQPGQIAWRLMTDKAILAGGVGLTSSAVPGAAAALFAVDLAATALLQAEMVYQIAYAYGLDSKNQARKAEILAIYGLSLGGTQALKTTGSYAVKAGLEVFLRNVPIAGALIAASTNAGMIYALGYTACRFYEARNNPVTPEETFTDCQEKSEEYLRKVAVQAVIMDQILVRVILAGNPEKTWKEILPELKQLNISSTSIEVIEGNIESPPSLESLLNQIDRDFAVSLLAQCEKAALLDGIKTPEESKVIDAIKWKFDIELDALTS